MLTLVCSSLTMLFYLGQAEAAYPKADLLIEPAALAKLGMAEVRIVDTRTREKYTASHIPGSVWIDIQEWAKSFGDGQDTRGWSARLGKLGILPKMRVVIYGDSLPEAARAWWILRYWGFDRAQLLHGGLPDWLAAGQKVTAEIPAVAPQELDLKPHAARLATKIEVLKSVPAGTCQALDARSREEYTGVKALAKRSGSIPKASHLEWSDLVAPGTLRFKSPADLTRLFAAANIDPKKPTITYCQSGGRAAVMAFALELMGGDQVRNYYRSWAEWGNDSDVPVAKPK